MVIKCLPNIFSSWVLSQQKEKECWEVHQEKAWQTCKNIDGLPFTCMLINSIK